MAYFFSAFNHKVEDNGEERIFSDLYPHTDIDTLRLSNKFSFITNFKDKKAIDDIAIKDNQSNSWMIIIGTPLIKFTTDAQKQVLIENFLRNPKNTLRELIDGNFAVLACDGVKGVFVAATDLNCTIPVFYIVTSDGALFSSSELTLAKILNSKIDPFGFAQAIHLGVTWIDYTRFQNLKKMLPGEVIMVDTKRRLSKSKYWEPSEETIWDDNFDNVLKRWNKLLSDTVQLFYETSEQNAVTTDFTAGEDTRLLVAHCHNLNIPFVSYVTGFSDDVDVVIGTRAARQAGFDLHVRTRYLITHEQLLKNAIQIAIISDGYDDFFHSCLAFATNAKNPPSDYRLINFCALPGGEAFRGSYYLRGGQIFPSSRLTFDYRSFTKLKYLLDHHVGLVTYDDEHFLKLIYEIVENSLREVQYFPNGIKIDHLLRLFQTCATGMIYKTPLYLPMGTNIMTRSIYSILPNFKRGGRLTKACTEMLFPELAFTKTQTGAPTIRKTLLRTPLFIPEHFSTLKKTANGFVQRLFKFTHPSRPFQNLDINAPILISLFNSSPYDRWFFSSKSMLTGEFYNEKVLNPILFQAKTGQCRNLPTIARIISQELSCRWVYDKM